MYEYENCHSIKRRKIKESCQIYFYEEGGKYKEPILATTTTKKPYEIEKDGDLGLVDGKMRIVLF